MVAVGNDARVQRIVRKLEVKAHMQLVAALGEALYELHLPEPGAIAAIGLIAVHRRAEGVEAEAEGRARRQHLVAAAVQEVLDETQHGHHGLAVLDAGREGERLAQQRRLALALLERGGE